MKLFFRIVSADDKNMYQDCFRNSEFYTMLFGQTRLNIDKMLSVEKGAYKFSLFSEDGDFLGFSQFFHKDGDIFSFIGGISPIYFNSGLGVYGSVCIIDFLFNSIGAKGIITGVFKYNTRSLRMLNAIGFKSTSTFEDKILMSLSRYDFSNSFNQIILEKTKYEVYI